MANTVQDNNRVRWTYTDDQGDDWAVSAKKEYTDQVDGSSNVLVGGSAAAASVPAWPSSWRLRRIKVVLANHKPAYVVLYETTAPLATPGTAFTYNENGVDVVGASTNIIRGERKRDATQTSS